MPINYDMLEKIMCFHRSNTDFITGENPPYHRHEDRYEIYMYVKGNTRIYIEDKCYIMTPGNLAIISPGVLHRLIINDSSPYERIVINIGKNVLDELSTPRTGLAECFEKTKEASIISLHMKDMKLYIHYVDEYLTLTGSDEYGADIMCANAITRLLIYINMLFMEKKPVRHKNVMPDLVKDTMRYIDDNLTQDITLSDLSNNLNYCSNYIGLKFKEHTGMTVHEYILDKRIDTAKKLLQRGSSVSDTCTMSGFNDYANFIRAFKKMTGVSPGKYR